MNLQRYVSTVYSESIRLKDKQGKTTDDAKRLDKVIADFYATLPLQKPTVPTFENLRKGTYKAADETIDEAKLSKEAEKEIGEDVETKNLDTSEKEVVKAQKIERKKARAPPKIADFLINAMFKDKIFGDNLLRLAKESTNTVILFPVYREKPNPIRLKDEIADIYREQVKSPGATDFIRAKEDEGGNLYLYIPALSEDEESNEEYTERIGSYLDRAFDFILEEKPKQIGGLVEKKKKLESILYTVNKEGGLFTDYYKKKIGPARQKILNEKVEKFVQRLGCRLLTPLDSQKKLTKEDTVKKYREQFGQVGDNDRKYLKAFDKVIDAFVDIYKKSTDDAYRQAATSQENQSFYKIFYRIHNTDMVEDVVDEVKTGSTHVYELYMPKNPRIPNSEESYMYGHFNEIKGSPNQYLFREYAGISIQEAARRAAMKQADAKEKVRKIEEKIDEQLNHHEKDEEKKGLTVEVALKGGVLRFKKGTQDFSNVYPGYIRLFRDLHIYERYKWFQFNELSGTLPPESKIKYYKNLRFDRSSVIGFLENRKEYNDKTRVAVEFLKINLDSVKLSEYASYLIKEKNQTHVYRDTLFGDKLDSFVEKTKHAIVDLLFESNELLYTSGQKSEKEKADISKNYKIVGHQYYKVDSESTEQKDRLKNAVHFFDREIYDNRELDYCKQKKCELFEEIADSPEKTEFGIAIVDITKENIEVVAELKERAKCKRLHKSLRKRIRPWAEWLPQFGGTQKRFTQKCLRHKRLNHTRRIRKGLTRRKNGH